MYLIYNTCITRNASISWEKRHIFSGTPNFSVVSFLSSEHLCFSDEVALATAPRIPRQCLTSEHLFDRANLSDRFCQKETVLNKLNKMELIQLYIKTKSNINTIIMALTNDI